MKKLVSVLVLVGLGLGHADAAIYLVSETRSVSASGSVDAGPGTASSYYVSQGPSVPFSAFSANVSSNAGAYSYGTGPYGLDVSAYASSFASQQSDVSANGFHFYSQVLAQTWSQLPTWGGFCQGIGESTFYVTFGVTDTTPFELTFNRNVFVHDNASALASCILLSPNGTLIDLSPMQYNGVTYAGILQANTIYTLNVLLHTEANWPDPLGELGSVNGSINLSLVPEPSSIALLGIGLAGFVAMRRKR